MSDQKQIDELKDFIATAEDNLLKAKQALVAITGEDFSAPSNPSKVPEGLRVTGDGKVIEGIFNGENMVGPEGKTFPVPANYASKSKLVEGDKLKLSVAEDGSFIFKQIGPVERKKLVGTLSFEDNTYSVMAEGKRYSLLYATVTFHKAKPGDQVTIVVPTEGNSNWAALENIIHDVAPTDTKPNPDEVLDLNLPDNLKEKVPLVPEPQVTPVPPVPQVADPAIEPMAPVETNIVPPLEPTLPEAPVAPTPVADPNAAVNDLEI